MKVEIFIWLQGSHKNLQIYLNNNTNKQPIKLTILSIIHKGFESFDDFTLGLAIKYPILYLAYVPVYMAFRTLKVAPVRPVISDYLVLV